MTEDEVEEVFETDSRDDHPSRLRQCTVLVGADFKPDPDFPVCLFDISAEAGAGASPGQTSIAVILISDYNGKLVVVFPHAAWHRTLSKRLLPPGVLIKPVAVDILCDDRADPGTGLQAERRVWLGQLEPSAEERVVLASEPSEPVEPDVLFDESRPSFLPLAANLAKIGAEHFGFVSATSGDGGLLQPAAAFEARLAKLESAVLDIAASLKSTGATEPVPSQRRAPALRPPAQPGRVSGAAAPEGGRPCQPPGLAVPSQAARAVQGLDLEVVRSARLAGIPEEHIAEMAKLASQGRQQKMPDFPAVPKRRRAANALSESDEEEELQVAAQLPLAGETAGEASSSSLTTAVAKLTEIAAHLTAQKRQEKTLEALLDGVGSAGGGESSQVPGSRKYAAALRALRRTLTSKPEEIYAAIERNMVEDFQMQAQLPGSSAIPVSARAWLELRSRVQNYTTPVRLLWGIAGIHDALRAGQVAEARARSALLLAQGDQLSIDRGSWIIAGELSLEEAPPAAAFAAHTLPGDSEAPYSRLIDGRWFDLFLQKLNDYDNLSEKKKKLSSRRNPQAPHVSNPAGAESGKPDAKKKAKSKGKGKSGGGGAAEAEEPQAAS